MIPTHLETPRLLLRPPTLADAPWIFSDYAASPEVTRYLGWRPHSGLDETRAFVAELCGLVAAGEVFAWVLAPRQGGEAVEEGQGLGMIDARRSGHRVELGYVLAPQAQGRGVMTEAVRAVVAACLAEPDICRVSAMTDVDNRASARVLERVGMQREGCLRCFGVHPNLGPHPRDVEVWSVVRR